MEGDNFFYRLGSVIQGWGRKGARRAFFDGGYGYQYNKGKVYINTQAPYDLYNSLAEISIPVDRVALMLSNGVFKLQNKANEKEIKALPPELEKLLSNPNPLQSQNEWLIQYGQQLQIYGNQWIYNNRPSKTTISRSLTNVNPMCIAPVLTGKIYDQVDMSGIVKQYELEENDVKRIFTPDEIIWSKMGDINSSTTGTSKMKSLKYPYSNTEANYKFLNAISTEMGAIGAMVNKPKRDSMGDLPQSREEKQQTLKAYKQDYGTDEGKSALLISNTETGFVPFYYPTAGMQLLEQNGDNFKMILNRFGVNSNLYINSTYENLRHGLAATHNDAVQPIADALCQRLSPNVGGVPDGWKLILDYSHLPYLQKDDESAANTFQRVSAALDGLVASSIITSQEANQRLINQFG